MSEINKNILEKYVQLDRKIHEQESKNTIKALGVKEKQLKDLEETAAQLQVQYNETVKQIERGEKNVQELTNVQQIFENQSVDDQQMTKEQVEYMDALNKQEVAKQELDNVREQIKEVHRGIAKLIEENHILSILYEEHDQLLETLFKGEYGSPEENQLECKLDMLIAKRQSIQVAHYKWSHGRNLLQHAVVQFTVAENKWTEVEQIPVSKGIDRYQAVTEARNNIIAGTSNLTSTQKYLSEITFPYCTPAEVVTLHRAVSHIYTDMLTPERHSHAGNVYTVTRKRAAALLQWFDNVIEKAIEKDLNEAKSECNVAEMALRKERLSLMKGMIAEQDGKESVVDVKGEMDLGMESSEKLETEYISMPDRDIGSHRTITVAPADVPASHLAPTPSQNELFGTLDSLKKQQELHMEEFEKAQEINKIRTEQGLRDKLAARRNRRERMQVQKQQTIEISEFAEKSSS